MSLVSIWRQVQRTWRDLSHQLWPEPPVDPFEQQQARLRERLRKLQQRMLATSRSLSWLATCQRKKERLHLHLAQEIMTNVNSPNAVAGAIALEKLRAALAVILRRRERLERRYQRLRERFHATRNDLAKLTR